MSKPAVLISTARVHPGSEEAFTAWQARHSAAISKVAGFISTDTVPPPDGKPEVPWTIIANFESEETLAAWKQSPERGTILGEVVPLLDGGNFGETVSTDGTGAIPKGDVTEVIFSKVKLGMTDRYREWATRIQAAQANTRDTVACTFSLQPAAATGTGPRFCGTTPPSTWKLG